MRQENSFSDHWQMMNMDIQDARDFAHVLGRKDECIMGYTKPYLFKQNYSHKNYDKENYFASIYTPITPFKINIP